MEAFKEPLTKEEEALWLEKLKNGEQHAKDVLVEHNLRLVAHIAKKYGNDGNLDDLISVGIIGLIKGINTFSATFLTISTTVSLLSDEAVISRNTTSSAPALS